MTQSPLVDLHTLELLASRICHDLISPVSAMNNGLEFLADAGPAAAKEAMDLLGYSATTASAKLQALRLVYGAGGADSNIRLDDIRQTMENLVGQEGRVRLEWAEDTVPAPAEMGSGYAKLLAAVIMIAIEALPRGGTVRISGHDGGARIAAEGMGAGLREGVEEALKGRFPAPVLDPKTVHPYITALLCAHYGFSMRIVESVSGRLVLMLSEIS